jgi:hypothetical protein
MSKFKIHQNILKQSSIFLQKILLFETNIFENLNISENNII